MSQSFKEVHVVSNTHWDREFRFPFQRSRMMLVKMMNYLLELLESDPSFSSYTLDAHSIMIEDYLEIHPENRQRIEKLVKDRRLFIGPWYTLPDIPNISQESVVRNLLYGRRLSDSFGHTMQVGYTPCSWGQTGQLPQIYAGFGIDTILFYRGISPHESTSEFIWEGADGTRALGHRFALFARYNYYYLVFRKITYGLDLNDRHFTWGEYGETPFKDADGSAVYSNIELLEPDVLYKKENLKPAFLGMLEIEGGQYHGPCFLAMHGHDISWPHPLEHQVVEDADRILPDTRVIHSDLERYADTLKKNLDLSGLPVLKGERRTPLKEGFWTWLLPGTISARTLLKKENFRTEMLLAHQAEPAAVLSWILGEPYPSRYLDLAWRHLLSTHTHDANAGCAPDEVMEDVRFHLRQSRHISEELVREALMTISKRVDTSGAPQDAQFLLLFNPLCHDRSELLELLIDVPEESGALSLIIRDPAGGECEYQSLSMSSEGVFVDNPWNVPQAYLTNRFHIKMCARDVPSLGYRVFTIEPRKEPDRKSGALFTSEYAMENEFLKVEAIPDGTITLTDKKTGTVFQRLLTMEDCGEIGNAWRHESPLHDTIVYSTGPAQIRKVEDGPLSATMKMDLSLLIPRDSQEEKRRSQDLVELPITHFITLTKYSRKIDVKTRFNNQARDHRLRILFPTGLQNAASSCADSHFDVVERSIELENSDHWKEPRVGTYPYRTFVDVSDGNRGLAILTEGLHEYEVLRNESRAIAITLVRSVRIKLEVSEQRKQELPDPGPQCPGLHEFRLAIYPHEGDWAQAGCPGEALGMSVPLRSAQFGKNKSGSLPLAMSLVSCSNHHIEFSAVKKAETKDALVVRVYNPTKDIQKGSLIFSSFIKAVYETNLNEEKKNLVKCSPNGFDMELYPKKIATYCIEILNKRIHDDRRKEILRDIKSAQDEFSKKQCRPVSPDELMKDIN